MNAIEKSWVSKRRARNSQHIEGMEVDEVQWGEVKVLRCLWEHSLEHDFLDIEQWKS